MHLARTCAAAALAALVSASASAQGNARVEETTNGFSFRITSQATAIQHRVAAPADSVWAVLPEVLRGLGITPQMGTGVERVIGNPRITSRRLAGERLDRYLRCANEGAGPSASSMVRIQLSVISTVAPEGERGSRLLTEVRGTATPVEGSGGTLMCASTGMLEGKIGAALTARVAAR